MGRPEDRFSCGEAHIGFESNSSEDDVRRLRRENLAFRFPTKSDTSQAVQPQRMAQRLEISD